MEIKTFSDLIDWTRQLHEHLSRCLAHDATLHKDERARMLLDYIARHEAELERIVAGFEQQADLNVLNTRTYDYLNHRPIKTLGNGDGHYSTLDFDQISREIFAFHDQVIDLYRNLIAKAEIPEIETLLQSLLSMEEHEAMRLASQIGRMNDV